MARQRTTRTAAARDDFDGAWKEVIERYLREFIDYFFPVASAGLDWTRPVRFLDKELQKIVPSGLVRKGVVDKLFEAHALDGEPCLIAVHLEVQNEPIANLEERVFEYHYRIYEKLKRPVASLVLLTDTRRDWRPHKFERVTLGCKLTLEFPAAKLLDFDTPELARQTNPFSLITRAHRRAQTSKGKPQKRYDWRMALQAEVAEEIGKIANKNKRRAAIAYWEGVLKFVEWVMWLPAPLEIKLEDDFNAQYGEAAMEFMTYREKIGFDKGEIKGEIKGEVKLLLKVLAARFGEPPNQVKEAVARIDNSNVLERLAEIAATCVSVDEFERALPR